jgi:hypothetical protein
MDRTHRDGYPGTRTFHKIISKIEIAIHSDPRAKDHHSNSKYKLRIHKSQPAAGRIFKPRISVGNLGGVFVCRSRRHSSAPTAPSRAAFRLAKAICTFYLVVIDIWPDHQAVSPPLFRWAHVQTLSKHRTTGFGPLDRVASAQIRMPQ